jgi:hypothetical protein
MSNRSVERDTRKKISRSIFAFSTKIVVTRSSMWRENILRSFLSVWLLLRAHLSNRHRLLEMSMTSSITCLKWRVLTLWMILCFLSLTFAYFSQFDLTRSFDQMRRFLRISLMIAKHSSFQNDLAYSLEWAHEMTTSIILFRKSCITAICWFISTTNRECIERNACSFSRLIFS